MTTEDKLKSYTDFLNDISEMEDKVRRETQFPDGVSSHFEADPEAEDSTSLGERVKTIREKQGLSLADVSSRTGLDEDHLARIEANEASPPLGELIKLGRALGMKMGYFISGGATRPYTVVRKSERKNVARRASSEAKAYGYSYQALAPGKSDRHMEPYLVTLEPSEDVDLSAHDGQEFIFVLEGGMEALIGQDRVVLNPGDAIYYDSNVPHMVRCVDGPYATILAVLYAEDK